MKPTRFDLLKVGPREVFIGRSSSGRDFSHVGCVVLYCTHVVRGDVTSEFIRSGSSFLAFLWVEGGAAFFIALAVHSILTPYVPCSKLPEILDLGGKKIFYLNQEF